MPPADHAPRFIPWHGSHRPCYSSCSAASAAAASCCCCCCRCCCCCCHCCRMHAHGAACSIVPDQAEGWSLQRSRALLTEGRAARTQRAAAEIMSWKRSDPMAQGTAADQYRTSTISTGHFSLPAAVLCQQTSVSSCSVSAGLTPLAW